MIFIYNRKINIEGGWKKISPDRKASTGMAIAMVAAILVSDKRIEGRSRIMRSCISREQMRNVVTQTFATPDTKPNSRHLTTSYCQQTANNDQCPTVKQDARVFFFY